MAIETTTVARTLSPAWHWYMPVARRQWWMRYPGITIDDLEKSANMWASYLGAFVGSVVVPFATARIRAYAAAESFFDAVKRGLPILGLVPTMNSGERFWEQRPAG